MFALHSAVGKTQQLINKLPNLSNASLQRNNLIKLTYYDKTEKMAHCLWRVRTEEDLKLSHGEPSHRQASGINPTMNVLGPVFHQV